MMDWASSLPSFFLAVFLALAGPYRRSRTFCTSADLTYRDTTNQTPMVMAQIRKIAPRKFISDLHYFVEEIRTEADAGAQKLFVELGTDAGGRKPADHFAVRIQAAL